MVRGWIWGEAVPAQAKALISPTILKEGATGLAPSFPQMWDVRRMKNEA